MGGLKRFLAVILGLMFVVLLPVALLVLAAQGLLLAPDFYKQQLVKTDTYSRAYAELLPSLVDEIEPPKDLPLTKEDIGELMKRLVPESFVRAQTEKIIDEVFAGLTSSQDAFQIVVPLKEIRQRIPDEVVTVLEKKLADLPPCSEPFSLASPLPQGFPTCIPPGVGVEAFRAQFRVLAATELRKASENLPDSIDLTSQFAESIGGVDRLRSRLETPRRILSDFAIGATFLYALLFVVLILVGALGGNSFNSGVGWAGATLIVGGIAGLLFAAAIPTLAGDLLAKLGQDPNTPKEIVSIMAPLLQSIVSDLMRRVLIEAGGVSVGGVVLFFISRAI
ncbi:MAG: hypothetical protein M1358_08360 [Chloroflexi bacterium]|nr:hypothetical protein [Chloroflexota bacterium]